MYAKGGKRHIVDKECHGFIKKIQCREKQPAFYSPCGSSFICFLALFNIYSKMILRNLEIYPGVKINGENINNIRYADDAVLIADSEENLQRLLDITIEKSEEMGLTLNVKKTECMVISKKSNSSLM